MSPRLPLKGTVESPVRPTRQGSETARPETPPHVDFGPSSSRGTLNREGLGRPASDASLDSIAPIPAVTISESAPPIAAIRREQWPLEHYWIATPADLQGPNAEGFRVHRGRRYVDVPNGGTVLVGVDTQTRQYRARLSTDLEALGPVLRRDTESGLWHPQERPQPAPSTSAAPGSGGLPRPGGGHPGQTR